MTAYDPSVPGCLANCSVIGSCLTCNVSASASGEFVECLSCSGGYSVDSALNACRPICGDGILAPEEACEDGNTMAGDGCGPSCLVEPHFGCNTSAASNLSECSLVDFGLSFSHLIKHSGENSGSMHFDPSPQGLPIYESVDWATVLSSPDPNIQVTGARYDPASGEVVLDFSYDSTVSQPEIQVALNTSGSPALSSVASFAVAAAAKASNNAALVFYEDSEYGMAKIVIYLAIMLAVAALLLFLAGLFGGRLIGLECLALVQLSFLSLLSVEDLSATLSELQYLRLSFGYNSVAPYDYGQGLGRPFVAAQLSRPLVLNFNIMAGLILVPLIAALVFKIASAKAADQARMEAWLQRAKYAVGEYALYLFLAFSYLGYLSLFVQVKYLGSGMLDYLGLALGGLFVGTGVLYAVVYARADSYFTEFREKFHAEGWGRRFYLFVMGERLLSPVFLAALSSQPFGTAPVMALQATLIVLLLLVRPYKGSKKNFRPLANHAIAVIIAGILLGIAFTNQPSGALALYGPFAILLLLIVAVVYSAYALAREYI